MRDYLKEEEWDNLKEEEEWDNYYKYLFTHKDINTYINGVVNICLNKFFFFFENTGFQKKREKICKIMHK